MKASQLTEAQMAFAPKQAEDVAPVAEVCRKAVTPDETFSNWLRKHVGLMPSKMRRLRSLIRMPTCGSRQRICPSSERCYQLSCSPLFATIQSSCCPGIGSSRAGSNFAFSRIPCALLARTL